MMQLHDWIPVDKLHPSGLCANPNAIAFLERNPDMIDWVELSANPAAIPLLQDNLDKVHWSWFSRNANAVPFFFARKHQLDYVSLATNTNPDVLPLLQEYIDRIRHDSTEAHFGFWSFLSQNPLLPLLRNCQKHIVIDRLALNPNKDAIAWLLVNCFDQIDWEALSRNPGAIDVLRQYEDKICWWALSQNPAAFATKLLSDHPERIDWYYLSANPGPGAITILLSNPDKIVFSQLVRNPIPDVLPLLQPTLLKEAKHYDWYFLSRQPYLFFQKRRPFEEELIRTTLHPRRLVQYLDRGYDLETVWSFF